MAAKSTRPDFLEGTSSERIGELRATSFALLVDKRLKKERRNADGRALGNKEGLSLTCQLSVVPPVLPARGLVESAKLACWRVASAVGKPVLKPTGNVACRRHNVLCRSEGRGTEPSFPLACTPA